MPAVKVTRQRFRAPFNFIFEQRYKPTHDNHFVHIPVKSLKPFYPEWYDWDRYITMGQAKNIFAQLSVKDGDIWASSMDIAKNLTMNHMELIEKISGNKINMIDGHYYKKTSHKRNLMEEAVWIHFNDFHKLSKLNLGIYQDMFKTFYNNAIKAMDYIEKAPWCQTLMGTKISGLGNLQEIFDVIMGIEINHRIANSPTIKVRIDNPYVHFKDKSYCIDDFDINEINEYKEDAYFDLSFKLFTGRFL